MRQSVGALTVRAEGEEEAEDDGAILLENMGGSVRGMIASPAGTDSDIFESYLAPSIGRCFADLGQASRQIFMPASALLTGPLLPLKWRLSRSKDERYIQESVSAAGRSAIRLHKLLRQTINQLLTYIT